MSPRITNVSRTFKKIWNRNIHKTRTASSLLLATLLITFMITSFRIVPQLRAWERKQASHNVPDGYPTIQDAIDYADFNYSDTIFVYYTITYFENINITKPWKIIAKQGATIDGNYASNVVTISANNTVIEGFTIRNSNFGGAGIFIRNTSSGNIILKNVISENGFGIDLEQHGIQSCSRNVIHNNTITNSNWKSIRLSGEQHNITENILRDNPEGISGTINRSWIVNNKIVLTKGCSIGISGTDNIVENNTIFNNQANVIELSGYNNTIVKNTILNNQGDAITLSNSAESQLSNVVKKNIISNNTYGVKLFDTDNCVVIENNISLNRADEVFLENSSNNILLNNTMDARAVAGQTDGIHLLFSNNNTIITNFIIGGSNCIYLNNSNGNKIIGNMGYGSELGVSLVASSNNNISGNNLLFHVEYGLHLSSSNQNTIVSNNIQFSDYLGLYIESSINNTLTSNTLDNNKYNFGVWGSIKSHFLHSIDKSNLANDRSIWYLINKKNISVDNSDIGYLALVNCTAITVRCLNLTKNLQGLLLVSTNHSKVNMLTLQNNNYGIYILWSENNTLYRNTIRNTRGKYDEGYGMYMSGSTRHVISENHIQNNKWGIHMGTSSNNTITQNRIQYNETTGAMSLYLSRTNTIYNNSFYTNNIAIVENLSNNWNLSDCGNYWHNNANPINETRNVDYHPLDSPIMSKLIGDVNYDWKVDIFDIVKLASAYGSEPNHSKWNIYLDLNCDKIINIFDIVKAAGKYDTDWTC